jgi:hypothetical protein
MEYLYRGETHFEETQGLYRVFQKELYNFESLYKFIQRTYTTAGALAVAVLGTTVPRAWNSVCFATIWQFKTLCMSSV